MNLGPSADAPATERKADAARLSPWQARLLQRPTRADVAFAVAAFALAALALWSGNAAAGHLSPAGARNASALLDELELPRVLPNVSLVRDDGVESRLWDLAKGPRTILTFYAPWCGPCQEELPTLVRGTGDHPEQLAVVVGGDEDLADVRRKLANLGLEDLHFQIDATRELETGARVTALPTTFLIGRLGRVQERIVGNSPFRLQTLMYKATNEWPDFEDD